MSDTHTVPPEVRAWQRELGAKAQEGLYQKFLNEVREEHPNLPDDEQRARAAEMKHTWLTRISRRGVTRRQKLLAERRAERQDSAGAPGTGHSAPEAA